MNNWTIEHNRVGTRWQTQDTDAKKRETYEGNSRIAAPKQAPKLEVLDLIPFLACTFRSQNPGVRITIYTFNFLHVAKCKAAYRRKTFGC